jgi:hypothetical protein
MFSSHATRVFPARPLCTVVAKNQEVLTILENEEMQHRENSSWPETGALALVNLVRRRPSFFPS